MYFIEYRGLEVTEVRQSYIYKYIRIHVCIYICICIYMCVYMYCI